MHTQVKRLPTPGKEYLCFQKDGKSAHSVKCTIFCVLNKVIDTIIEIDSFEKQCVILKGLLYSEQLKQHMVIIGVDQSLSNIALYKHICLENIKTLYKLTRKCDYQHQYKAITKAAMVYTTEGFNDNTPISSGPYIPVKQPSARRALRQFLEKLDTKPRSASCRLCTDKSKRKGIIAGGMLWKTVYQNDVSIPKSMNLLKMLFTN